MDGCAVLVLCVVSYRNSTSNHNPPKRKAFVPMLYLIEILHQTTTMPRRVLLHGRCILSKFYIKPQLTSIRPYSAIVVSYRNSTSNHNSCLCISEETALYLIEILHQTTTYGIRPREKSRLYLIEILHQTTTARAFFVIPQCCILSKFYIKPQLSRIYSYSAICCILSKFYIKPQLRRVQGIGAHGCILSKFYIKPQQ